MDNKTYKKSALRTNTPDYPGASRRVTGSNYEFPYGVSKNKKSIDLLHASMGLVTEAAEFQDALKKHIFYNEELDKPNLKEEIGDILWYCAIALESLETDFDSVMQTNINKLKSRYPDKFTEKLANNRDLDKERKILEDD